MIYNGGNQRHASGTTARNSLRGKTRGLNVSRHPSLSLGNVARNLAASTIWRMPGCFGVAHTLGPSYSLRCVVFHDIATSESSYTREMGVSITPNAFEAALRFITKYYTPVCMQDVLDDSDGHSLPPRAILVTFDDGYASVMEWAAPLCAKFGVPAIFFINAAVLDNQRLAPDNLVCYAANELGMETINRAARVVKGNDGLEMQCMAQVFSCLFPTISLDEREVFLDALVHFGGLDERQLAGQACLYLTRKQLGDLASSGFEIGNHTFSHVHGRCLTRGDFAEEIDRNHTELTALSGNAVRAFSLPYGSSADLTDTLEEHLRLSGYEAVFLSESVANSGSGRAFQLDRVSWRASSDDGFFFEIEVLPRLRAIRNRLGYGSAAIR
jgi:peptidoglycan/xylan/chitin deacetylase (PgdA/CDA1 family)